MDLNLNAGGVIAATIAFLVVVALGMLIVFVVGRRHEDSVIGVLAVLGVSAAAWAGKLGNAWWERR